MINVEHLLNYIHSLMMKSPIDEVFEGYYIHPIDCCVLLIISSKEPFQVVAI